MFHGLKSKLEKNFIQFSSRSNNTVNNQEGDAVNKSTTRSQNKHSNNSTRAGQHLRDDSSSVVDSEHSSAGLSLVDLSEDQGTSDPGTPIASPHHTRFSHSTPIADRGEGQTKHLVDHLSPAVLDLFSYESSEDITGIGGHRDSREQKPTPFGKGPTTEDGPVVAVTVGRSRNSSVSSQVSDSYYFSPNSGIVPVQRTSLPHHQRGMSSDVESVASELDEASTLAAALVSSPPGDGGKMLEFVSKEELLRFYKKMQAKNQKYTGKYSQVVTAYKELERERDRLKEVLTKCQDKAFQRISELKEQLQLKDMAMTDVEVNYTMMLQEKEEVIKVLQTQINILKYKPREDKLIDLNDDIGDDGERKSNRQKTSGPVDDDEEEVAALKKKIDKMSGLLGSCKATILRHREEIKQLQDENQLLKTTTGGGQTKLEALKDQLNEKVSDLESRLARSDQDKQRLLQDLSLLQADHEALSQDVGEAKAEKDVLASESKELLVRRLQLEENLNCLAEENAGLKRRIDELNERLEEETKTRKDSEKKSSHLEKLLEQRDNSLGHWKRKIMSILEGQLSEEDDSQGSTDPGRESSEPSSFHTPRGRDLECFGSCGTSPEVLASDGTELTGSAPDSCRSGNDSSLTSEADREDSSVSDSRRSTVSREAQELDVKVWKQLEDKLRQILAERHQKINCSSAQNIETTDEDKHSNVSPDFGNLKESLEAANKERTELRKSLITARTQVRIFKNLCHCIFKAVAAKGKEGEEKSSSDISCLCQAEVSGAAAPAMGAGNTSSNNNKNSSNSSNNASTSTLADKISRGGSYIPAADAASPGSCNNSGVSDSTTDVATPQAEISILTSSSFHSSACTNSPAAFPSKGPETDSASTVTSADDGGGDDRLRVTRSDEALFEGGFTVRQSVLNILKDGLHQTMRMLDEKKKSKRKKTSDHPASGDRPASSEENILLDNLQRTIQIVDEKKKLQRKTISDHRGKSDKPASSEEIGNLKTSSLERDLDPVARSRLGPSRQPVPKEECLNSGIPEHRLTVRQDLGAIREEDDDDEEEEEWETVDEDEDYDGFIDDYDNLNLDYCDGRVKVDGSLHRLLLDWKTGCENFEMKISKESSASLTSREPSMQKSVDAADAGINSSDVRKEDEEKNVLRVELEAVRTAFENLKSELGRLQVGHSQLQDDYDKLLADHSKLQVELEERCCHVKDLEQKNIQSNKVIDELQHDLKDKFSDADKKESFLVNAQSTSNELAGKYEALAEEHLRVQDSLRKALAETSQLRAELAESGDDYDRMRNDLSAAEVRFGRIMDENRRMQMEQNILQQDHFVLRDDHEKLLADFSDLQSSHARVSEGHDRLQKEHRNLQEDHKNLLSEFKDLKEVESDLVRNLDVLRQSHDGLEKNSDRVNRKLAKLQEESTKVSSDLEAELRLNSELSERLGSSEKQCSELASEIDALTKSIEGFEVKVLESETKSKMLSDEVASLRKELDDEKAKKDSVDVTRSDLERTKSELETTREDFDKLQIDFEFLKGSLDRTREDNCLLEEKFNAVSEKHGQLEEQMVSQNEELVKQRALQIDYENRISSMASDISVQNEEKLSVKNLQVELEDAESRIVDLRSAIDTKDGDVSRLSIELRLAGDQLKSLEAERTKLEELVADLRAESSTNASHVDDFKTNCEELEGRNAALKVECEKQLQTIDELNGKLSEAEQERTANRNLWEGSVREFECRLAEMKKEVEQKEEELVAGNESCDRILKEHVDRIECLQQELMSNHKKESALKEELDAVTTNLSLERSTNEINLHQLQKQLFDSQTEIASHKETIVKLNEEIEILKRNFDSKESNLTEQFEFKAKEREAFWRDKIKDYESARDQLVDELCKKHDVNAKSKSEALESLKAEVEKLRAENEELKMDFDMKIKLAENSCLENLEDRRKFDERIAELESSLKAFDVEKSRRENVEVELMCKLDEAIRETDRLTETIDRLSAEKTAMEIDFDRRLVEKENEIRSHEKSVEKVESDLCGREEDWKKTESGLRHELESEKKLSQSYFQALDQITIEKVEMEKLLKEQEEKIEKLEIDLTNVRGCKDTLESELSLQLSKALEENELRMTQSRDLAKAEIEGLKARLDEKDSEVTKEKDLNKTLEDEIEQLKVFLMEKNKALIDLEEVLKSREAESMVKEDKTKCLQVSLEEKVKTQKDLENLVVDLKSEIGRLKASVEDKNRAYESLEAALTSKESEITTKTNEIKKKAELKLRQIRKEKEDISAELGKKISALEMQVSDLNDKLENKEERCKNLNASINKAEDEKSVIVGSLREDVERMTSDLSREQKRRLELESLLAEKEASLLEAETSQKEDSECVKVSKQEQERLEKLLASSSERLAESEMKVSELNEELQTVKSSRSLLESKCKDLEEAIEASQSNQMTLEDKFAEKMESADDRLSEKMADLEKKISEAEKERETVRSESEIVKKKNQSLKQEVRRLRSENETNVKAAELDRNFEIERLKREYTEEMNEREEENESKIKQLLKEFQIKMAEKEKEYQDSFSRAVERFESEGEQRAVELCEEMKDLRQEVQEKDLQIDDLVLKVEELSHELTSSRSREEWSEMLEKNRLMEEQVDELRKKLTDELQKNEITRVNQEGLKMEKSSEVHGSQSSLASWNVGSFEPVEFEYLKTVLYRYMVGTADKQTMVRVICKVMKFSESEENQIMDASRR